MLFAWFLVILGLVLLVVGGEALVRGASGMALLARMSPAVVGLTIVAAGTSAPETVVSVQASFEGNPGLAVGNVVGSNVFNICVILGLTAVLRPLRIRGNTVRLEWPVMMLAAFQLHLLARDGVVDRLEGGYFVTALVIFFAYAVWVARRNTSVEEQGEYESLATASFGQTGARAWLTNGLAVLVGVGILAAGSNALVRGAVRIAASLGVPDAVIGLTVVAAGTSTPELVTALVAARRGQDDIAVGNVIGSNIFNVLGTLGTAALILPLEVPARLIEIDNWWMIGISALLFPLMRSNMQVNRIEGVLLLAVFGAYMVMLIGSL